jgi:hypothetical protein
MKIAIFGDSWAWSCFEKLPNFQEKSTDLKFQQMFNDCGITADNYAISGGSNLDTLKQIRRYSKEYDTLIVFQTDPIRQWFVKDNKPYLHLKKHLELPDANNFKELCERILQNFYQELERLTNEHKILLIGGCTKLSFDHIPERFITLSQSWTELVTPEFTDCYYYWTEPTLALYEYARKKLNWNSTLSDFFEFENEIKNKNFIWQNSDNFSWCHAAKPAYITMFQKIKELLKQ